MDGFIIFRKYFLLVSQLIGASVCVFFIINVQKYEITWNLLLWLLPSKVVELFNSTLSMVGTMVLIIPLTIIILSILIPENLSLKIAGSFFGIASSLIILTSGIFRDTISQSYNMRIFLVSKILSIDEKREIFKVELIRILDKFYKDRLELYNYLQEKLLDKYGIIYDTKLTMLKETTAIKSSAGDLIQQWVTEYNHEKHILAVESLNVYLKYTLYAVGSLLVVLGVCAIGRYFFGDDHGSNIVKTLEVAKEIINTGASTTTILSDTNKAIMALSQQILELSKIAVTKDSLLFHPKVQELITTLTAHSIILKQLGEHVNLPTIK